MWRCGEIKYIVICEGVESVVLGIYVYSSRSYCVRIEK